MNEKKTEEKLQELGLNAPRLNPEHIDNIIIDEYYHIVPNTTLTLCVLTLRNGFTVSGESAAASPENFNEKIGREISKENARNKIWALEGYLLKQKLYISNLG
ncbi:MAG: Unknown protein [uncultured Sulfurovum sp.]|uniref:Phage protein n=1 Tax=uncultured Sulfurovum sp. TaxID=269237 RepID=A0A6S6SHE7_9BACT|nr:MAG: Unknown protein [uncultured Sulfurovum sp.]